MKAHRNRDHEIKVRFTEGEIQLLRMKMDAAGIKNREAYIRKMSLDGLIVKKDYTLLRQIVRQIGKIGANVNQLAKIANTYNDIRTDDLEKIGKELDEILQRLT